MPRTLEQLAREAIDVQDACNLSGVVRTYARVLEDLWALPESRGTTWVNQHPVAVLFADKVAQLTGTQTLGNAKVMEAFAWAREHARWAR